MTMTNLKAKQLAFSSKYNVDIYEFQYGVNRRKPRSDRGRRRGKYREKLGQAKDTAVNAAKYGAGAIAADQIFSQSQKLAGKATRKFTPNAVKKRIGQINPKSIVGRIGRVGRYGAAVVVGDQAVRAVGRGFDRLRNRK
jgi:hypothetical protein